MNDNLEKLRTPLYNCRICPRNCGVDRGVEKGYCRSGLKLKINSWFRHTGEEPVISGSRGSGTIFFSNCNLHCCFCQNYRISQLGWGREYAVSELVDIMLALQAEGVHNINLVTPTHFSLQIAEALSQAKSSGLQIPVIWNSNAYEKVETLRLLKGLVDIYLPDFKYGDASQGLTLSNALDYPDIARKAIREMHDQVGFLKIIDEDTAVQGLLIRLLLLPDNRNSIEHILEWIALELGTSTCISLMSQYYPAYKAAETKGMNRSITSEEFEYARNLAEKWGFRNGFFQEIYPTPEWTPDFRE
ncbi:MAG: radical SAM protein [Candidatus Cloacimonetes bacterium]|nr:radical SAM protein [Candidatus Cloacimonadota bacterium]